MRYLSLFSGIEAASVAWHPLGWECAAISEIEPFPCAVLAHRYPGVPNLGDVTKVTEAQIAALGQIDLVVFGSPCQDLSVAGKRKGLAGARSGLFFTAMQIVDWARLWCGCRFALWENVPGAFSSNKGADFAAVVDALSGVDDTPVPPKGWGTEGCAVGPEAMVEWAVLDAQWFGVAQRRRRVFALADFGNWVGRPPVLLEPDRLRGDSAPSREAGEGFAAGTLRCTDGGSDVDHARAQHLIASGNAEGSTGLPFLTCSNIGKTVNNQTPLMAFHGSQDPDVSGVVTHPVGRNQGQETCVAVHAIQAGALRTNPASGADGVGVQADHAYTLEARAEVQAVQTAMQVRRLTPRECERLQGFPDDYTLIPWRKKPASKCPDGPRYKALGNSMAVPVMRWIGRSLDGALLFQED